MKNKIKIYRSFDIKQFFGKNKRLYANKQLKKLFIGISCL